MRDSSRLSGRKAIANMKETSMTDTEVYGQAVGRAIFGEETFGKAQCAKAMTIISSLVKTGRCDDATADRVRAEIGNHSAVRQHCEKHALVRVADDAKTVAVRAVHAELEAELDKLAQP